MSTRVHEPELSDEARNIHRALASLQEELEATDWYHQRMDTTDDDELKELLEHNRDEEIEHAAMLLEYLRRKLSPFDEQLRTYLFTDKPLLEVEEGAEILEDEQQKEVCGDSSLGLGKLNC